MKETQTHLKDSATSKTPIKKPQPKLQSQNSMRKQTEAKPTKSKAKTTDIESQTHETSTGKSQENQIQSLALSEFKDAKNLESIVKPGLTDEPVMSMANNDIMPREVAVGG